MDHAPLPVQALQAELVILRRSCRLLAKALRRIADAEPRSDRRHRDMVGVEEVERLQRTARVALKSARVAFKELEGEGQ